VRKTTGSGVYKEEKSMRKRVITVASIIVAIVVVVIGMIGIARADAGTFRQDVPVSAVEDDLPQFVETFEVPEAAPVVFARADVFVVTTGVNETAKVAAVGGFRTVL
jgi:hypothetical protein